MSEAAPTGWTFLIGTPVFALIGLFGPGFQGLITRRVSPSEQGRLQGANTGSAFFLAATLHAIAAIIPISVMARAPKAVGAAA